MTLIYVKKQLEPIGEFEPSQELKLKIGTKRVMLIPVLNALTNQLDHYEVEVVHR